MRSLCSLSICLAIALFTRRVSAHTFSLANTGQHPIGQNYLQGIGNLKSVFAGVNDYDAGLFTPLESLDALSETQFTTMRHPAFPPYSVRVKKSRFCDNTVNSYTGYIDIEARHLFFYFFESRNDPDKDDVIFWTNGGPGCSSSLGLFMELGPCRVLDDRGPKFHPESWNSNANIFFIDQPIGVGFSYAEFRETVSTTEEAAKDIAAFVFIFFENISKLRGRAFHMAGESYAGRYLPVFASEVYDQNARLIQQGLTPINLTSVMIGNGWTDPYTLYPSYYVMQCSQTSLPPVTNVSACVAMKKIVNRCGIWLRQACLDQFDAISCGAAARICEEAIMVPFIETGRNPYDMSRLCDGTVDTTLCYPFISHISHYLDKPDVRDLLGVDPSFTANFSNCNMDVYWAFSRSLDQLHPTVDDTAALLERNVRVLIYVGSYDWVANWIGNERWTLTMEWSGQEAFAKQPLRDWFVDGKQAGTTRSAKGFTFATLDGAGHMAPYDKPRESLELINRWIANQEL